MIAALIGLWMAAWAAEPVVVLPSVQEAPPARAPGAALPEGEAAAVELAIDLDEQGRVLDARVISAPTDALGAAAVGLALDTRFSPATQDGVPVPVTINYRIVFDLTLPPPEPSLEGLVRAAGTREPMPGLVLELTGPEDRKVRVVTGDDGRFTAFDLSPGAWTVQPLGAGLRLDPVTVQVEPGRLPDVTLYPVLDRPWELEADTVIEVVSRLQAAEVTERVIDTQRAMALPGSNGDILKAVLNLPGLARPPLGIGQLIVRGTRPDASRFYVDGVRLPLAFHFGGLSTVLNGDILSEIRFYPGNYSVRYGDGVGGIVDLATRPAPPERSRGYVSVDVYQAAGFIEQKVGEKTSISASFRRSYADAVLGPILSSIGGGNGFRAPRYYDAQLRVLHRTDRGVFDALAVVSDDEFRLLGAEDGNVAFGLSTRFLTVGLGFRGSLADGWRSETRAVVGPERQAFLIAGVESFEEAIAFTLRQEFSREAEEPTDKPSLGWRAGLDVQGSALRFGLGGLGTIPRDEGGGTRVQPALYAENTLRAGPVTLTSGVRAAAMLLREHASWTLDPRAAVTFAPEGQTSFVATIGRYSQFPLSREVLETSRGEVGLAPSWSLQASGTFRQRLRGGFSAELTAWWSELYDLVSGRGDRFEFTAGPPTPVPADTDAYANDGRGRAMGAEVLLKLEQDRAIAWLSASFGRSTRIGRPGEDVTLFPFDQTVVINALGTYELPKRWTIGARLRFGTGNPYSPVVNRVLDGSSRTWIPIFGDEIERIRAFWAADIRVDKTWVFKRWQLSLYLDVQGITDPGNTELINYSYDFATEEPIRSTPPLPAFGLKGAW